jgi:hypothetical protein|tara:strand:- start:87 stop:2513 length:2427 start_codon:yes stop_codon:yes gene_type:complete
VARRENELFIGEKFLNIEGRTIKHPALIKVYATPNSKKINEKPLNLISLDLETDAEKGDLRLLGIYDGQDYCYYTDNFIVNLFMWVKGANSKEASLCYWNRLDPFIILKEFLRLLSKNQRQESLIRFGKISGEYNKKKKEWVINPVCKIKIGSFYFGIMQSIHTSIQFFYYRKGFKGFKKVWAYDIAQLYQNGLEKEANARFNYYSKVDKSAHLVNWERFNNDNEYKYHIVLKSNELDARACYDLGMTIQNDFFNAFKYYPKSLISAGSLARSSIIANIFNRYSHLSEREQNFKVAKDVGSIGFMYYYDAWTKQYGQDIVKDLFALSTESYSGGYIEAIRYGYTKEGYYTDIASAYPGIIQKLYDLRNAKLTTGNGTPPEIKNSYCFIRGVVNIPQGVNFHPITIKHPLHKETNIRATGKYRASYTLNERKFLLEQGTTFENETWINIETKGQLSPLAKVCIDLINMRKKFLQESNSSQYIAKLSANSLYGILFEAVNTYTETQIKDGYIVNRAGYRAGEFFNPIYASIITSETRLLMSRGARDIERNGGKVILMMTDSIFWKGNKKDLPEKYIRENKTLGYFERVQKVNDIVCLGSGRYGFKTTNGYYIAKKRGLNSATMQNPNGIDISRFNWHDALKVMKEMNADKLKVKVKTLISPGLVLHDSRYNFNDLGRILQEYREIDAIVGKNKRFYDDKLKSPRLLAKQLINTSPIYLLPHALGKGIVDQTLPELRKEMFKLNIITRFEKYNKRKNKNMKAFYKANPRKAKLKENYEILIHYGYTSEDAQKMKFWSKERINATLKHQGII